jgi:hypothetical protein
MREMLSRISLPISKFNRIVFECFCYFSQIMRIMVKLAR